MIEPPNTPDFDTILTKSLEPDPELENPRNEKRRQRPNREYTGKTKNKAEGQNEK